METPTKKMTNIISRNHNFENILNWVKKGRKYFYLAHEKDSEPRIRIAKNERLEKAFQEEDWLEFERAEFEYAEKEFCI